MKYRQLNTVSESRPVRSVHDRDHRADRRHKNSRFIARPAERGDIRRYLSAGRAVQRGFTVVELAVVIAVVAILITVGVVAVVAVQKQARDGKREASATTLSEALEKYYQENGEYPSCATLVTSPQDALPSVSDAMIKAPRADADTTNSIVCTDIGEDRDKDEFAYLGDNSASCASGIACQGWIIRYREEATGEIKEFRSRHNSELVAPASSDIAASSPIQNVASSQCAALPIFTGSNTDAIRTVTDNRGGTTRTYEIAKLADNKCWMLSNLKLGGSSPITLTPSDSDVSSDFTLPALITGGGNHYDNPRVYGPVPGDTGSGATNYGYLYNFAAATAGETRTSLTSGNAASSICPSGWRLPTSSDFAQLDIAFGGTGSGGSNGPSQPHWLNDGAFRGDFSGYWHGSFLSQGSWGGLWSASTNPGNSSYAFNVVIRLTLVNPGSDYIRYRGVGVRCLLN